MTSYGPRYSFIADYFDTQANMVRQYQLFYYYEDKDIEMHDLRNRRIFLKRCPCKTLNLSELFVGATVTVFGRILKISDYGDEYTRSNFATNSGSFYLVVYGEGLKQLGNIVTQSSNQELRIANIRLVQLTSDIARDLGVSPKCCVMYVNGSEALQKAEQLANHSNDVKVFTNEAECNLLNDVAFRSGVAPTATMKNCSVLLIKPHAITSSVHGPIIQQIIDEGFQITALAMFSFSMEDAEDFFEVYNGVVPEHKRLVEQCASGACWAMEVVAVDAVNALRAVCGPHDPEICHVLYPHTIRSKYGIDRARNAVHCTDLAEDAVLESEFLFSLMLNKQ